MTFHFGAAAGGVWKTTDGGTYWSNVSDRYLRMGALGALQTANFADAVRLPRAYSDIFGKPLF